MIPSGRLREFSMGASRADIILVTKTPKIFSPITKRRILEDLKTKAHQKIYFSYIKYGSPVPVSRDSPCRFPPKLISLLLLTGIANEYPLKEHLSRFCSDIITLKFPDHHKYTEKDIEMIKKTFFDLPTHSKVLITTEKDVMRLKTGTLCGMIKDLPLFYLPIEIELHEKDKMPFHDAILEYILENRRKRSI